MRGEEVFTGPVFVRILMPTSLLPVTSESLPVVELGSTPLLRQDLAFVQGLQLTDLGDDELPCGLRFFAVWACGRQGFLRQDKACSLCNFSSSLINDHWDIRLSFTTRYCNDGNIDVLHPISASGKWMEEIPVLERISCSNLGRYAIRNS